MVTTEVEEKLTLDEKLALPRPFIARRLHSLLGLWLVIYLFEHLLVNAQVAFYPQDDGTAFISMVNRIHNIPFLKLVEVIFLGFPFLFHGIWGIFYAKKARLNSVPGSLNQPRLFQYAKNRAFSWQRITSWILLVGILAHVIHMRFLEMPTKVYRGDIVSYFVKQQPSNMLYLMVEKLHFKVYTSKDLEEKQEQLELQKKQLEQADPLEEQSYFALVTATTEDRKWLQEATKKKLKKRELLVETPSAGAAFLLIVRDTFQHLPLVILYSILVITAVYHAFNGLWTFLITWGLAISRRTQKRARFFTTSLMLLVMAFGLIAAWGSYLL